jgi:hypothetical protein
MSSPLSEQGRDASSFLFMFRAENEMFSLKKKRVRGVKPARERSERVFCCSNPELLECLFMSRDALERKMVTSAAAI